jgi:hypothetical protein
MLTLILIILIFIKIKIPITNYAMFGSLLFLLVINEVYNHKSSKKDNFSPYIYDGTYDKYFKHQNFLHQGNSETDNIGLRCSLNKNISIKKIQEDKFSEYKDFADSMNNVVYGNKEPDTLKMPDDFGNISKEKEKISKINSVICPPVCHLIENEGDCNNAVDFKEVLTNESKLLTTKPVFENKDMLTDAYECLKSNPCDISKGCKEINGMCVYNKKKCFYDTTENKCRQKCELYKTNDMCNKNYCKWDSNNLKCENKN